MSCELCGYDGELCCLDAGAFSVRNATDGQRPVFMKTSRPMSVRVDLGSITRNHGDTIKFSYVTFPKDVP
jgi:hypothetical protein